MGLGFKLNRFDLIDFFFKTKPKLNWIFLGVWFGFFSFFNYFSGYLFFSPSPLIKRNMPFRLWRYIWSPDRSSCHPARWPIGKAAFGIYRLIEKGSVVQEKLEKTRCRSCSEGKKKIALCIEEGYILSAPPSYRAWHPQLEVVF
jgi:hypothetical protein